MRSVGELSLINEPPFLLLSACCQTYDKEEPMFFLSALSAVIGIVSGLIGIYRFIESRKHPILQRRVIIVRT